jgi:hypothetical protein
MIWYAMDILYRVNNYSSSNKSSLNLADAHQIPVNPQHDQNITEQGIIREAAKTLVTSTQ